MAQLHRLGASGGPRDFYNLGMRTDLSLEPMTSSDWEAVRAIYGEGIATGNATFEQTVPEWKDWDARHLAVCRIVARSGDDVLGWAALSGVSQRYVYRGVAEVSVYVAAAARGRGVGTALLAKLVLDSEAQGFWTLQAGIFPENAQSIKLHLNAGFRAVGTRSRLGSMNGRWRDVVLLERRSLTAGT